MTYQNNLFLQALKCRNIGRTPVWIMRQAGRYLPEYRRVREQAGSFITLCKTPELACEVTLQPLRRFSLDAAILFSDILVIPDALGLGLSFVEGEGPKLAHPIKDAKAIAALPKLEAESAFSYVLDTIRLIKAELKDSLPLIGFSGSPFTMAAYMLEGNSSKEFKAIKTMLYQAPQLLAQLLQQLTIAVIDYLSAQIQAGVDVVMLFDSWGGMLAHNAFLQYSLSYQHEIIRTLKTRFPEIPIIQFTKGGGVWLQDIMNVGANCIGLDWQMSLDAALALSQHRVALQGNLDPMVLYGDKAIIKREVTRILTEAQGFGGHIFNLGHGILPDVDPNQIAYLIDCVHELSSQPRLSCDKLKQ